MTSANPERYLPDFVATFSLPPNHGSPIIKVHYRVIDAAGAVIQPLRTVQATNPTELRSISGPERPGDYRLQVSLEDQVGWVGPASTAPIPRDTTPPAAPQNLRVVGTTAHRVPQFDVRWQNVLDAGSPIDTARYQVIDGSGQIVAPTRAVKADNVQAISDIGTPPTEGDYEVRVWVIDAEGNSGAPSTVAVPRDTTPPAAPQGLSVAAPSSPRSAEGFDLRWRNLTDAGSPIDAAHYQVLNAAGAIVVPTVTVRGGDVQAIESIDAPNDRGDFDLRLWLRDAEGNVGAPASVPLAYDCMRSNIAGGSQLSAGLDGSPSKIVEQGQGATLRGELRGVGGNVAGAGLCVFSQVAGETEREFLGVAITDSRGDYHFAVGAGPSRTLSAVYRPDQRRIVAEATLQTRVKPSLRARRQVVRTGEFAQLEGEIPGPRNDDVVIVLQVRQGNGWLAFRRYRTRGGGRFEASYLFRRTTRPTTYEMRAQMRESGGYPYLEGDSDPIYLRVLPRPPSTRQACPADKRRIKRDGKSRCVRKQSTGKRCAKAKRPGRAVRNCARSEGRHGQVPRARSGSR